MAVEQRRSVVYAQNFLRDPRLVERLVRRAGIGPHDLVLEIGPGAGVITERLAAHARRVVAVEKDALLAARLQRRFAGRPHVAIRPADFLDCPLPAGPYKVFANIPFNVTAAIVGKLTSGTSPPNDAFLVVQAEAAQRYVGSAGGAGGAGSSGGPGSSHVRGPRETLAALLLKPWFEPSLFHRFRRDDFAPPPGVDVLMLRLRKRGPPLVSPADAPLYRDFVVHVFTARRRCLGSVLAELFGARRSRRIACCIGIEVDDPQLRPGTLPFDRWPALFQAFRDQADPVAHERVAGAARRLQRQQAGLQKQHRTRGAAVREALRRAEQQRGRPIAS